MDKKTQDLHVQYLESELRDKGMRLSSINKEITEKEDWVAVLKVRQFYVQKDIDIHEACLEEIRGF